MAPMNSLKENNKLKVVTAKAASQTHGIEDAMTVKNQHLFFVSTSAGQIPLKGRHA